MSCPFRLMMSELPCVDTQASPVAAGADIVWRVLTETLDATFGRAVAPIYAQIVGCVDTAVSGPRPLTTGSTVPGFRVVHSVPASELQLEGRHRFASYSLTFRLEPLGPGRSHISAETRARFPGVHGRLYRLLVIGSGGHAVAVRRLLAGIRSRSEVRAGSAVTP